METVLMSDDLPTLDQVFEAFDRLYKIIDIMDANYKMYANNHLMKYYQNRGLTLRDIFTADMLDWLCFLGWQDDNIDVSEVKFINDLLKLNLTQLDILEIVKVLSGDILDTLPLSFAIFMEHESITGNDDVDTIGILFASFALAGTYFIACDGEVDPNELEGLEGYLKTLESNIQTFNLESVHEYMLDNI
jgi:hypothetical protein